MTRINEAAASHMSQHRLQQDKTGDIRSIDVFSCFAMFRALEDSCGRGEVSFAVLTCFIYSACAGLLLFQLLLEIFGANKVEGGHHVEQLYTTFCVVRN